MLRTLALLSILVAFVPLDPAQGGPPDPSESSVVLSGSSAACQFRFRPDAGLDDMLVTVTVNDANGDPCGDCPVLITVEGTGLTLPELFCSCCPAQTVTTDGSGVAEATFSKIGGAGTLVVNATAQCSGNVALIPAYAAFTSTDVSGDCGSTDNQTIEDDALIALGRNPFGQWVDFNCTGDFTVVDLGLYAGGTAKGCGMSACP